MELYLAGPMTGLPLFNFPAFFAAAMMLRDRGHVVINPAERDMALGFNPGAPDAAETFDLHGAFKFDFAAILRAGAVALLPGWRESAGTLAELVVATYIGATIYEVHPERESGLRLHYCPKPSIELPK